MFSIFLAEGPNGVHLPGDVLEVYWGTAAFVVLFGILIWQAGPPITKALKSRTEKIEAELAQAKAERSEAEAALLAKQQDSPDVGTERQSILDEAGRTAVKVKEDLIAKAKAEAEAVRARGIQDVENQKKQALAEITARCAAATKSVAEELVHNELDDQAHENLIDEYIVQVEQLD